MAIRLKPLKPSDVRAWEVQNQEDGPCVLQQKILGGTPVRSNSTNKYVFDQYFGEEHCTMDVFDSLAKPIVESVGSFSRKYGTIFAHGATNCGKTYTISGECDSPGLIQLSAEHLFSMLHQQHTSAKYSVRVQYIEIYNEQVRDLLDDNKPLAVLEDKSGALLMDAHEHVVVCAKDVVNWMNDGNRKRACAGTILNPRSSRSHGVFSLIIERQKRILTMKNEGLGRKEKSILTLVDLAGSENSTHAASTGIRKHEGGMINQSLLTLSQVIKALSMPENKRPKHISYRSSKLTRIIRPQLSGNATVAILSCIDTGKANVDETKSSLKFATSAKKIILKDVIVKEDITESSLVASLQKELTETKEALEELHNRINSDIIQGHDAIEDDYDVSSEAVMGEGIDDPDEFLSQSYRSLSVDEFVAPVKFVVFTRSSLLTSDDLSVRSRLEEADIKAKFLEEQLAASDCMAEALFRSLRDVKLQQYETERLLVETGPSDDIKLLLYLSGTIRVSFLVCLIFVYNGCMGLFVGIVAYLWISLEVSIA